MFPDLAKKADILVRVLEEIDLANYFPGIVELYSKDGVQYAIPKDHDTIAAVYNKAVFDKYGVEYPTDDLLRISLTAAQAAINN